MLLISIHPEGIISTYYKYFIKRKKLRPNVRLKTTCINVFSYIIYYNSYAVKSKAL